MTDQELIPTIPTQPFTYTDLMPRGVTRHHLDCWLREGVVRRVVRGGYLPVSLPDTVETRARTAALVVAPGHVATDRTAAAVHGIDTLTYAEHDVAPPVECCAFRGSQPTQRTGVAGRTRDLTRRDIESHRGLLVTTPLRTALDLGCLLRRREAMAALDAFARLHGLTIPMLATEAQRFRGRRGVVQLRELIGRIDPAAESARESWTRLAILDAGLPAPELQVWIVIDGIPTYRLDLAYRRARIAIEYDGFDAHDRDATQMAADRERRAWLRANGWVVIVLRRGDFTGAALERWLGELKAALRPSYSNIRRMERNSRLDPHNY